MTEAVQKMMADLSRLSAPERAEVARFLIHSLDDQTDPDAEEAWDAELTRRAEEIRSGQARGEPAEKVFDELREKFS